MISAERADAVVRERTTLSPVPLVPEIRLYLASQSVPTWEATEEEAGETGLPPPFWAFAWVGGQALARYVLDRPDAVQGKRVLDLATGSGIVAIAAKKAGAKTVIAADTDPFAEAAFRANVAANKVDIAFRAADMIGQPLRDIDVVLVGDFFYDRDLAGRTTEWLAALCKGGCCILIGDPGRAYLPKERLAFAAAYDVPASREIEDGDRKRCTVFRWKG